jgi:Uma2 family endonuclease
MTPAIEVDPGRTRLAYERDAMQYSRTLTWENLMESTAQATQRKITVESFDLISRLRPDIQCFNELLIQYPRLGEDPEKPVRVVPDNMIVVHPEPLDVSGSYMLPIHRVIPTLVFEYVSKSNTRKDYEENYWKYEQELKIPYYIVFNPENKDLQVFRLEQESYLRVAPGDAGRFGVSNLELEVALLHGWIRFWFRGELIPLPAELADLAESAETRAESEKVRAESAERERDALAAELARLREQLNNAK